MKPSSGGRGLMRSRVAMAVLASALAISCGSNSTNPVTPTPTGAKVTSVAVASVQTSASSIQLKATAQMSDNTSKDVTSAAAWTSSNTALATVSSGGLVTIVGSGELDVTATYQGVSG